MTMSSESATQGAVIEIIEKLPPGKAADPLGVIIPNEVRINGQSLLCSASHPVTVHQMDIQDRDVAMVTLTLFARRVRIDVEEDDTDE